MKIWEAPYHEEWHYARIRRDRNGNPINRAAECVAEIEETFVDFADASLRVNKILKLWREWNNLIARRRDHGFSYLTFRQLYRAHRLAISDAEDCEVFAAASAIMEKRAAAKLLTIIKRKARNADPAAGEDKQ
jgi:hypothetical protein